MTRKNVRPMGYPYRVPQSVNAMKGQGMGVSDMKYVPDTMPTVGDRSLAMVYPEWQQFRELYAPDAALCKGTLFKELDKPFCY